MCLIKARKSCVIKPEGFGSFDSVAEPVIFAQPLIKAFMQIAAAPAIGSSEVIRELVLRQNDLAGRAINHAFADPMGNSKAGLSWTTKTPVWTGCELLRYLDLP
jgi:hypothetical protein